MGLTALLYNKLQSKAEDTAIIVCGGNIDIAKLQSIFKLGTVSMGLRIKAKVTIGDQPGKMLEVMSVFARYGAVVDYVRHTRNTQNVDWDTTILTIEARMPFMKATSELKSELMRLYKNT